MQCIDCRDVLEAYHDAELPPHEMEAIRAHLRECAQCTREAEQLASVSRGVREGLDRYVAPDVLRARVVSALARESATGDPPLASPEMRESPSAQRMPRRSAWLRLAAAGLVIAAASSAATFALVERGAEDAAVRDQIVASHIRSLLPGHLIDVASNDQHNVKPWFNGRVDLSPAVPALDSAGFSLVGGRLDYTAGHSTAVVVYRRRQHLINVYSWAAPGSDAASSLATENGYHAWGWRRAGVAYWAVSDLNARELADFVRAFQARAAG